MKYASVLVVAALVSQGLPAVAAPTCDAFVLDDRARPPDNAAFAQELAATAREASDAGCLAEADRLLEGAHRLDPLPGLVYARILVRESMGDFDYAHTLLEAYRAELAADPSIEDLVAVDARLRTALRDDPVPAVVELTEPVPARRTTLDTVGPIVLAGLGAVSLGLAVYGFTARCDQVARDGTCLSGSEARLGPTVAYSATGVVALTAAAVWWIIAIPRTTPQTSATHLIIAPAGLKLTF